MILYLLVPLLLTGINESQTANVTVEEPRPSETNQTINVSTSQNVTVSLSKDEIREIEEKLQNNQTSMVITEENEEFQNQDTLLSHTHCQENLLVAYSHGYCGPAFHKEMLMIGADKWCLLESVSKAYYDLTYCLENLASMLDCYYPNSNSQDFFLQVHSHYFQNCTKEVLEDAPHWVVMVLTLIPVSLIPILVYVVVWKSKVQE